jgi:hypothetical protein
VSDLADEGGVLQMELLALVREFHWRMGELEREVLLRANQMSADDQALVRNMIAAVKGSVPAEF